MYTLGKKCKIEAHRRSLYLHHPPNIIISRYDLILHSIKSIIIYYIYIYYIIYIHIFIKLFQSRLFGIFYQTGYKDYLYLSTKVYIINVSIFFVANIFLVINKLYTLYMYHYFSIFVCVCIYIYFVELLKHTFNLYMSIYLSYYTHTIFTKYGWF